MRNGRNSGFGKLTAEVRAWVPDDTEEGISALAALAGVPKAEYVREILMYHVHGHLKIAKLRQISARNNAEQA